MELKGGYVMGFLKFLYQQTHIDIKSMLVALMHIVMRILYSLPVLMLYLCMMWLISILAKACDGAIFLLLVLVWLVVSAFGLIGCIIVVEWINVNYNLYLKRLKS